LPGSNGLETRVIQEEIIKSYVLDFAKHVPAADIPKFTLIWDSITKHLARENKKFVFSAIKGLGLVSMKMPWSGSKIPV